MSLPSPQTWLNVAVLRLQDALQPEQIVLFGSWARGTASRRSDIDLFIVLAMQKVGIGAGGNRLENPGAIEATDGVHGF